MKILIADSNPKTLSAGEECLKYFGEYDLARDGQNAFEMIRQSLIDKEPYQLVYANLNSEEYNALNLLRLVRTYEEAFPKHRKTKFIIVSDLHKNRTYIGQDRNTVILEPLSKKQLIEEIMKVSI